MSIERPRTTPKEEHGSPEDVPAWNSPEALAARKREDVKTVLSLNDLDEIEKMALAQKMGVEDAVRAALDERNAARLRETREKIRNAVEAGRSEGKRREEEWRREPEK